MLVSEYIVEFLRLCGTEHVFGYPGGMVTHLMDAFSRANGITAHVNYHEQASAFSACGYASASGKVGAADATSGPGATNLVTGIAEAYFDSVPVIFITGQVNTYEGKGNMALRQKGFQETDIVSIVKPVTKMAEAVTDENDIRYILENALYTATEGRKGPVLLDIPMNIQRSEINPDKLRGFDIPEKQENELNLKSVFDMLKSAKRPCIIAGAGIKQTFTQMDFLRFAEALNIPVLTSMIAVDLLPYDHPLNYGFIGAYGDRKANFIASKADLILTLGTRLDCRQTGAKREDFAVNARFIRFDTDINEFENKIHDDDLNIQMNLETDMKKLADAAADIKIGDYSEWLKACDEIKKMLEGTVEKMYPEILMNKISESVPEDVTVTTDVGQNQVWVSQHFKVKKGQNILFSGGMGAMGYSLPASIGASLADGKKVICFSGDGGFMMNMQELQFISRERLPIKICVFNNNALGMIRHFQEMYFSSKYSQTVAGNGYTVPELKKVADAFGINYKCISELNQISDELFSGDEPVLIEVMLPETTYVFPKLAVNKPIQDQEPPLDRELYRQLDLL
ncbi:MAG: thiamine pyrophosphate-binding protein [Oscillospiraceae bacterium]|nr:thiamine pyrophosphate-binding protein [Oscillospiraceae bacterium]